LTSANTPLSSKPNQLQSTRESIPIWTYRNLDTVFYVLN